MAKANNKTEKPNYAAFGIERREDVRHDIFTGTADALVAAGLVRRHQLPGQLGSGKTMASYWPDGTRVRQGSSRPKSAGHKQIYMARGKFVIELRPDDHEVARREALWSAVWAKETKVRAEAAAWRAMREGIARCCVGELNLVWSEED